MKIIINHSSMIPIYEQIVEQVKALIRNGKLKENDNLPSVRSLAKELKISALTVKKAYDSLENEGFTVTIHGKGTFVLAVNKDLLEEAKKEVGMVIESIDNIDVAYELGKKNDVYMPIIETVYKVIYEGLEPAEAVKNLMTRDKKSE